MTITPLRCEICGTEARVDETYGRIIEHVEPTDCGGSWYPDETGYWVWGIPPVLTPDELHEAFVTSWKKVIA